MDRPDPLSAPSRRAARRNGAVVDVLPAAQPRAPRRGRRPGPGRRAAALLAALLVALLAAGATAERTHVVAPGDTLYDLARRYDTDVTTLREVNGLAGSLLRVGEVLELPGAAPAAGFRRVIAAEGDTLRGLAEAHGLEPATVQRANPELEAGAELDGRLLLIPPVDGWTVRAAPGETLARFAARHGADPAALARRSGLAAGDELVAGQPLLLLSPPSSALASRPGPAADAGSSARAGGARTAETTGTTIRVSTRTASRAEPDVALLSGAPGLLANLDWSPERFAAPLDGRLTSGYGWRAISVAGNRFHNGVDLGAAPGTPVRAARDGRVSAAGWIGSYGYAVYLDHGDGTQTRYAHMSRVEVRVGDRLRAGDPLGAVGSTGASTGPHLHFEIRVDGRSVDPLLYLSQWR